MFGRSKKTMPVFITGDDLQCLQYRRRGTKYRPQVDPQFLEAMEELVSKGYKVDRLGDRRVIVHRADLTLCEYVNDYAPQGSYPVADGECLVLTKDLTSGRYEVFN